METPNNTEVFRMLRDVKDVVFHPPSPFIINKGDYFKSYMQSFSNIKTRMDETPSVATKLNFSFMNETQAESSSVNTSDFSTISDEECHKLKRKLESTEVDLLVAQAKIKDKEGMIGLLEPSYKKVRLDLEKDLESFKRQNEVSKDKIRELRSQIKFLSDEVADSKNQLIEHQKQNKIEHDNLLLKMLSIQLECSNFKSEVAEAKSEKAEVIRKLNIEIGRLELEISSLTEENKQYKNHIQSLKRQLSEQSAMATLSCKLQKTLSETQAKTKELENKLEANKDASLIARTMQSELKLLPELCKENKHLKEELSKHKENNLELLQEKIWNLQGKLSHAEKKCVALIKVKVENEQLKEKVLEWETLFHEGRNAVEKSPMAFSKKLSYYQKNEIILTNKLSQLTLRCESLETLNKKLEAGISDVKNECSETKQTIMNMEDMLKRNVRKIHILAKERDNSRKLIDSYVSETTLGGTALNIIHIKSLEDTISNYKQSLEKVEEENVRLERKLREARGHKSAEICDTSIIEQLRNENYHLLSRIEEVLKSNHELEQKLKHPVKTETLECKVVHLRCNPADEVVKERIEEYKFLREENDKLHKRIAVLEEEGATAEDVTMKVQQKLEEEGSTVTVENLNKKLSAAEKKSKVLMDAFRKTSQEFRESCYMLTGYKIEVPMQKKYKLSHMYAESPDDYLLFELSEEGNLNLLESDYSKRQMDSIETYLMTYDSIPAFLSSLTMELFSRQTCVVKCK